MAKQITRRMCPGTMRLYDVSAAFNTRGRSHPETDFKMLCKLGKGNIYV